MRGILCARFARLLLAAISLAAGAFAAEPANQSPDRVLVQLRDVRPAATRTSEPTPTIQNWSRQLALPAGVVLRSMHPKTGPHSDARAIVAATESLAIDRPSVVELNGKLTVAEALARLKGRPDVVFAEPDFVGSGGGAPNDPSYPLQWFHQKIQSEGAWSVSTGNSSVVVAVLDSGINLALSEFAGRLVPGHDYVNNDNNPSDDYGHGTMVAGVLAANANNGVLGAGVNWQCRILPEKVLDSSNNGFYSVWAQAIYDVTDLGAKVINLSAGGTSDSATLQAAIDYAIAHGSIFVTITHNDGTNVVRFPGRLPECITVGGTEPNDTLAPFSNYGPSVDLVAPADSIYSVGMSGMLENWHGTSFAAPQVSAVAAIIAGLNPNLNQAAMEQLIRSTAQDQVGGAIDTPGWDQYFGSGRLNASAAVHLAAGQGPSLSYRGIYEAILNDGTSVYFFVSKNGQGSFARFDTANQMVMSGAFAVAANGEFSFTAGTTLVSGAINAAGASGLIGSLIFNIPKTTLNGLQEGLGGFYSGWIYFSGQQTTPVQDVQILLTPAGKLYALVTQAALSSGAFPSRGYLGTYAADGSITGSDITSALPVTGSSGVADGTLNGSFQGTIGPQYFKAVRESVDYRMANISTRGSVGTGANQMIAGFIIKNGAKRVLIRAIGPSLTALGVPGALGDPVLVLNSASGVIATNDNWQVGNDVAAITATGLAPGDVRESALLLTLEEGAYTAIVSGAGGSTGVALVEVYEID